ncbi:myo-inositol-1-phosphate synthase [Halovenus aranensis]|uniref:Myo-inositol-1-phosphate synthase n=1 Tax=Halovenus aranensis TaxID=890420 RepID=A0A1G8VNH5_9EURY|nr:inositol-3-phosphate synthase [Halovenus aranensis]SDJ67618.1 myo-inositol-1-phosphate synthase [Halovenus aranensis]
MKTGVWLIGARGNVAAVSMVGAKAIAQGRTDTTGMVTAREPLSALDLPAVEDLVFGGHDIRSQSITETALAASESSGVPPKSTIEAVEDDLDAIDSRIETGTAINCGQVVGDLAHGDATAEQTVPDLVSAIRADYEAFVADHDLDRLVVVNVASTEPPIDEPERYDTADAVRSAIENDDRALPASVLYAYAALEDGHPYVNFTPSTGSNLDGLCELARERGVPHMGQDAKTGETLVKSALAPMFAGRNLRVLSWEGHNILGNTDGLVLEDDDNKAGKVQSKDGLLEEILGYETQSRVRIDYTPSLGDRKTAWDHIHFEGFLGTEMKLQFTWEGSDSALAAPLVLDLIRLVSHADAQGRSGVQPQLAAFFKSPMAYETHDFSRQHEQLQNYATEHRQE